MNRKMILSGGKHVLRAITLAGVVVSGVSGCTRSTVVRNDRPVTTGTAPVQSEVAQTTAVQAKVSQPKYGATYVVQRGETLYRIAVNNGITPLDLALWNNIPTPYTIYPGQRLRLYPHNASAVRQSSAQPVAPVTVASAASQIAWQWPVSGGEIISTYLANDTTRQGIDIAGNGGEPVRAVADGIVVYSGTGLVGYGEFVIIKHGEQWLSAYGHNRRRLVNEGEQVKAGQQIGELGSSGAPRNMLHFEIRQNGRPVDPLMYLPKR